MKKGTAMDDANRMLSQEEIDVLLTSQFANNNENGSKKHAKSAKAVLTPEKPPQLLPQGLSPSEMLSSKNDNPKQSQPSNPLEESLADLTERVKKLEMSIENLQKQNIDSPETVKENSKLTDEQLSRLDEQVADIAEKLKGTAGYNINKTYTCRQCGSVGIVGIRVRCNQCGQEDWWGWWPKKNK
jgi:hypothetical protein